MAERGTHVIHNAVSMGGTYIDHPYKKIKGPRGEWRRKKEGCGERREGREEERKKERKLTRRQPPNSLSDASNRRSESTNNIALAELANTIA